MPLTLALKAEHPRTKIWRNRSHSRLAPETKQSLKRKMAARYWQASMDAEDPPEDPSLTFRAGNYVFTRAEARACSYLHQRRTTVWQLKEQRHPTAMLEQIVVAIQVGIMAQSFKLSEMNPIIFDPTRVCLGMWRIGEPSSIEE